MNIIIDKIAVFVGSIILYLELYVIAVVGYGTIVPRSSNKSSKSAGNFLA